MASNFDTDFGGFVLQFVATYWMHSTILLGAAWLLLRLGKQRSHLLRERIWKYAAIPVF